MRTSRIKRKTLETDIDLWLCLDGGERDYNTGIGFFDHMLNSFAVHGGFGLTVKCSGDLRVDCHHTVEDTGIVLGKAFAEAVSQKQGFSRFGSFFVPMDEALAFAAVDISGRPYLSFSACLKGESAGGFDPSLTEEFMRAFAVNAGITLHIKEEGGKNAHHQIEAIFKAVAHALKAACKIEGNLPLSTKGTLI